MANLLEALDRLRSEAENPFAQGRKFERLIKAALSRHPGIYGDRFQQVWLWDEWPDKDGGDIGIDLVAQERDGGYCAIQCKFFASTSPVPKKQIDSFLAASERHPFTARLIVNTGGPIQGNTLKTLQNKLIPCRVLEQADLAAWPIDWMQFVERPEALQFARKHFEPYPYQQDAIDDVIKGFERHDRGQLILPCGTGKTAVALWIAERMAGVGKRVLYLVPSIALMAQTMREWAWQKRLPHRYAGICSDTRVGRTDEDASLLELDMPVGTDSDRITETLRKQRSGAMLVAFSTYQSLELVAQAQDGGAPEFDLVICDEAHRTTGIEKGEEDKPSPFLLVHDAGRIRARKRLFTTATPRIYTDSAKGKAADHDREVFSMDDEARFGPEFYRMQFSEAIAGQWLTDYKVAILCLKPENAQQRLAHLWTQGMPIDLNLDDATKLAGCWDALADPEGILADEEIAGDMHNPARRAIAFANTIRESKLIEKSWSAVIDAMQSADCRDGAEKRLRCDIQHVDGTVHSLDRTRRLNWLKEGTDNVCRILTNARCLTEGVDVPALDAVLFMQPRKSQIDVVQAVGRVMRKAPDKEFGYIILPVVIPEGVSPESALDDNKTFKVVWSVLQALRSHDDRLDAEINSIDLNRQRSRSIRIVGGPGGDNEGLEQTEQFQLSLDLIHHIEPGAIYAKIVEKCGDRKYWPKWAEDVADIADRIRMRVTGLVQDSNRLVLEERFMAFLEDLRSSLNREVTEDDAVAMIAQHMITGPVFQALFQEYDFVESNPVSQALNRLVSLLEENGLENETRDLEPFYASVRLRARTLDNQAARQKVLLELYERFFKIALRKDAERLGIVYTPVEVVDFILRSADWALRQEFGLGLTAPDVHILDPFTGTGTFLVRLLQHPALIRDEDLARKFRYELHANEIVLLAYYIAAINIEEAFHGRRGMESAYEAFKGIVLCDTFNLDEDKGLLAGMMPANSERAERQKDKSITVIVGNPPYSAGQRSASDNNPNVLYPALSQRVRETHVAKTTSLKPDIGNVNSAYDSYKMALRWASDRIGKKGIIAFVTNGSFIDTDTSCGLRACLAEEFSKVYIFNLRGNQRTQGERSRKEGGKIFGSGSRAPVAISVLVRNASCSASPASIRYLDVGDYLTRDEKIQAIEEFASIAGIEKAGKWDCIEPDEHHNWLEKPDPIYQSFILLGAKETKNSVNPSVAARRYSRGVATGRDAWVYDFSIPSLKERMQRMTAVYEETRRELAGAGIKASNELPQRFQKGIKWDSTLLRNMGRGISAPFSEENLGIASYRPFVKMAFYLHPEYIMRTYQIRSIFPTSDTPNSVICVTGKGSTKPFSTLITNVIPDLELVSKSQCFARWTYVLHDEDLSGTRKTNSAAPFFGYHRIDNITDWCLDKFHSYYNNPHITKADIWHYLYGMLHAPDYQTRFAFDLSKSLPRIPLVQDFTPFAYIGKCLGELHIGYETAPEYPLEVNVGQSHQTVNPYKLGRRKMQWRAEKTELQVTDQVLLRGIPPEAHKYVVNGRTPLEWAIDRLHVTTDKESGIVRDPNGWFVEDPSELVRHLRRLVYVSVQTMQQIDLLPPAIES